MSSRRSGLNHRGNLPSAVRLVQDQGFLARGGMENATRAFVEKRRTGETRESRLERTKAEVAARLRPVCNGWCDGDFEALVAKVAAIEVKYALRRTADLLASERSRPKPS